MIKLITSIVVAFAVLLSVSTSADARRHVYIHKPAPSSDAPIYNGNVPLIAIPPLAVVFDLERRTSCDPNIARSTGAGDPGFDPSGPRVGNFLLPAIHFRCGTTPRPKF